ncbi:MAG: hypothetical protein RSB39_05005 [Oscillospiraceae bacterium]
MWSIVICDDEAPIADLIERKVRRILGEACRIKTFYSAFSAETYLLDEAKGATDILKIYFPHKIINVN